jgi:site-specific recombinase XerD
MKTTDLNKLSGVQKSQMLTVGNTTTTTALAVAPNPDPAEEACPFRRLIREWLSACKADGLSPKTIDDYTDKTFKFWWWWNDHTHFAEKLGAHPENITVKEARQFAAYLRDTVAFRWGITKATNNKSQQSQKLSDASIAAYGRTVKAFFNWLEREDYIEASPFNKSVKFTSRHKQDRIIKIVDDSDLSTIFQYLMQPDRLAMSTGKRNLAMVAFLLDTGVRRGELLNIKLSDLDLERNRAIVSGKTGQRHVFFEGACREALKAYLKVRPSGKEELWLCEDGEPLSYQGFGMVVRRLKAGCGVDFHAHKFRHTFASTLARQGIEMFALKEILGHTSITTTQVYVHQNADRLAEAYAPRSPLAQLPEISKPMKRRVGRPRKER